MKNYNDENLLEMVELYAFYRSYIDSEQALSDLFDVEIAPLIIEEYGVDDEPAMSEGFNNWSDSLCKDGEIHPVQYSEYCYIGEWS